MDPNVSVNKQHRGFAESRIHQSLITAFDSLIDGVVIADMSGTLLYWNRSSLRLRGFTGSEESQGPLEMLRRNFVLYSLDGTEVSFEDWPMQRMVRGESVKNLEFRVCRTDTGSEWIVLYNGTRIIDPESDQPLIVLTLHDLTDERRSQQELTRTGRLLQAIYQSSTNGILIKDCKGKYLFANPAAAAFSGLTPEEIIGRFDVELIAPDSAKMIREQDEEVLRTGNTSSREYPLQVGAVTRIHVGTKIPYRDESGKIIGLIGIIQDVTDERAAERELRESEQRFRELADAIPQIVWIAGPDGGVIGMNQKTLEYAGLTEEALAGWNWESIVHADDIAHVLAEWGEIRRSGQPRSLQFRLRRHDGLYRWHITRETPIFGEDGTILRWYGTCTDIDDQIASDEALRISEDRFRTFVENTADAFFLHDELGKVLDVNEQACRSLGYERDELIGKYPPDFDPDISLDELEKLTDSLNTLERVVLETRHCRKDGTIFPVEVRLKRFWSDGKTYSIATVQDITRRKSAETALRESEERYRMALDVAELGTWRHDLATNEFLMDERCQQHHGMSIDRVDFSEITSRMHPDDQVQLEKKISSTLATPDSTPAPREYRILLDSDEIRWLSVSPSVQYSSDGKPAFVVGTTMDVTARKRAEDELRRSESLLRSVIDNADSGISVKDLNHRYTLINRYIEELFQKPASELIGKTAADVFTEEEAAAFLRNNDSILEIQATGTFEERVCIRNREMTFVSVKFPIKDEQGRITSTGAISTDITDRINMERALRESEARLRTFVENAGDSFSLHERGGRIIDVNQQTCDSLGYSREELIGHATNEFDVGVSDEYQQELTRCLDRGETLTFESRHRRKDGSEFPTEVRIRPFWVEGVRFSVALARDISERKRMEAALRESEIRLRTLVDHASDGFFLRKRGGEILDVNQTACESLGYRREELVGSYLHDYVVGLTEDSYQDVVDRLDSGETVSIETRHRRRDGSTFPVEIRIRPFWVDGERYSVSLVRDVTDRLRAERELRSQQMFIQRIADASPHVFYVFDIQQKELVYSNRHTAADLGFSGNQLDEFGGKNILKLMHPDDARNLPELLQRWDNVRDDEILETEFRLRDSKGKWHWYIWRDTVFTRDREGRVQQIVGTAEDVTERRVLEDRLQQAQKMEAVGQLAGGVAHDFNNLLTVVNGYCDLLLADEEVNEITRKRILPIREAGESAASLTQQLLAFGRRAIVSPRVISLNDLIVRLETMLKPLIGEDIFVRTNLEMSLPSINADQNQIEQVILNLAVNARDAMPQGGTMSIWTSTVNIDTEMCEKTPGLSPGEYVQLSISDTGQGIEEQILPRIFEPFYTTKGAGQGTGLGLAVVHGIITQSGGAIKVESRFGEGTRFDILLPAVGYEKSPIHRSKDASVIGSGMILLIEDEEAVRKIVTLSLVSSGYRVVAASGRDEAIEIVQQRGSKIDLIITDVVMPGRNGREIVEEIRDLQQAIPVLFISGYTDDEVVKRGVFAATDAFLQKPFTPATLTRMVHELLQNRPRRT